MTFFRMVRPMRRKQSSFGQFRQSIPLDVRENLRGRVLHIPVGDTTVRKRVSHAAVELWLSLRTRDPHETRERHAAVAAYLERVYRGLRSKSPVALSHREIVQLAGEFYRAWANDSRFASDQREPITSLEVETGSIERHGAGVLQAYPDPHDVEAVWTAVLASPTLSAERLGPLVDHFLLSKGLNVAETSRETLLHEAERALRDAFEGRRRNAAGDYSADLTANRFGPPWGPRGEAISGSLDTTDGVVVNSKFTGAAKASLTGLIDVWRKHPEQEHISQSTVAGYRYTMQIFSGFLKHSGSPAHDDARRVTKSDVEKFREHRLQSGIKPKTVKTSDLSCLNSLFSWAVSKGMVSSNPAQGITVKVRRGPQKQKDKGFDDDEAQAVLTHAWGYRRSSRVESAKMEAAKRWVPWLCAYSGTRVGEMAQLRKEDVKQEKGYWVVTITHEAGTNKRKATWDVPVHPHLIEMGFLEFVKASEDGHLFLTPRPDLYRTDAPESRTKDERGILGPLQAVKNRLRERVREVVANPNVAPNHGWRHRFKTVGRECRIDSIVLDKFAGHAPKNVSDGYGDVTIKTMLDALKKMPRYEIEDR